MKLDSKNKLILNLVPFLLGLVQSFSLPPYNFLIINFITFPILLLIIIDNSKESKWILFKIGWLFGFGYFISNLYWITNSLTFEEIFKPLIPIALIVIPLFLGLFYGFATLITSFFELRKDFITILLLSLSFSIMEFIRGFVLGGFPWNLIVFSWSNYIESLQILSFIGTYSFNLISITIFSLPLIIFFKKSFKFKFLFVFSLCSFLALNHIFGTWVIKQKNNYFNELDFKIKIVSPKIDIKRFLKYEDPENSIKELISLAKPNPSEKTIFIFPEGILANIYFQDLIVYKKLFLENFSNNHTIFIGTNTIEKVDGKNKIYNSLAVIDNKLNLISKYDKNKLVPFGEFLPFENFFSIFGFKKITFGYESFSAGKKRKLISVNNINFLPLICYEIIYSGNLKKNNENFDFIVNISEDGWFGNSIGPHQHFSHSIFRAIEEGKNVIRVSNNGISAVIDSNGIASHVLKSTTRGVIEINKFKISKTTFFSKFGNKIFFYFVIFYIILIFLNLKKREKQ